jgi:hypothetical protein
MLVGGHSEEGIKGWFILAYMRMEPAKKNRAAKEVKSEAIMTATKKVA